MLRHLAVALVVSFWSTLAGAVDVTTCDQLVGDGEIGEVTNDLDCGGGSYSAAVRLGNRATLRLNGHRLNGPTTGGSVVEVLKSAKIVGPGEIDTNLNFCIGAEDGNLIVDGGTGGIDIHGCRVGVDAQSKARVSNVTVHDNTEIGVFAARLTLRNATTSSNGTGARGAISLVAKNVTASGNLLHGLTAENSATIHGATVDGNGLNGVSAYRVAITDAVISNSGQVGARAVKSLRLKDSSVTGTGPGSGDIPPNTDLYVTERKPTLVGSTCGKSAGPHGTWGVCSND